MIVYFSFLYVRYRAHIVTDEMLKLPKWRFILVGFLEALGVASGMAAGGKPRLLYMYEFKNSIDFERTG